jgi:preprotein translocase subunit SecB
VSEEDQPTEGAGLGVQRIYLKDCSFEAPLSPDIFTKQIQPKLEIHIDIEHSVIDKEEGLYEVVLPITVKANVDEGTVYLAEVQQAGVFQITGIGDDLIEQVLEINCPDLLLPFARQTISSLVMNGGFPQLLINPVNFGALFGQRHSQAESA